MDSYGVLCRAILTYADLWRPGKTCGGLWCAHRATLIYEGLWRCMEVYLELWIPLEVYGMLHTGLPQLKEISFKMTITLERGSIFIAYIIQSFEKLCVTFCQIF